MNESLHKNPRMTANSESRNAMLAEHAAQARLTDDERYPGSFFRVPGVPKPGKTTWSLAK